MRTPQRKPGKYTGIQPDYNITEKKLKEHKAELKKLIKYVRPPSIKEVKRLALMGDFSENAAYQIAKGRLRGINRRILVLENIIKKANIIQNLDSNLVQLGSIVKVEMDGKLKKFEILGSSEVDPLNGIISNNSPLGKSLIGRKKRDSYEVLINGKNFNIKIIDIK